MKKIKRKVSGIILVFVALVIWCIYSYEQSGEAIHTNAGILSNTKIGWGIKRAENHMRPELRKDQFRANAKIRRNVHRK